MFNVFDRFPKVFLKYLSKIKSYLETTINVIHFPSFQKRTLSVSTYRKAQSEWLAESTDNAPQSVPNEADVVVIGNVPYHSHRVKIKEFYFHEFLSKFREINHVTNI